MPRELSVRSRLIVSHPSRSWFAGEAVPASLAVIAMAVTTCAASSRPTLDPLVAKPATWTRGDLDVRVPSRPRRALIEHIFCLPEPTPELNTSLWVWEIPTAYAGRGPGYHRWILDSYVVAARGKAEVVSPIASSEAHGLQALTLEIINSTRSPHAGSTVHSNNRYWSVAFRDRVILIHAQQPVPPDPKCSAQLEAAIRETLLRLDAWVHTRGAASSR